MHFRQPSSSTRPSVSSTTSSSSTSSSSSHRGSTSSAASQSYSSPFSFSSSSSSSATTSSSSSSKRSTGEIQDIASIYAMTLPLDRPVTIYYKDATRTHFSAAKAARESRELVRVQTPGPKVRRGLKGMLSR